MPLKKVRGARGELTSGKELSDIKQKIGFPENNVLQKLKSTERKLPTHHEVGYNQLVKTIIPGNDGFVQLTKDSMNHNNNQVGFIHTHPYESKLTKKKFKLNNIDQPSGIPEGQTQIKSLPKKPMIGDLAVYGSKPTTKFPIYAPSENTVSVSRVYEKKPIKQLIDSTRRKMDKLNNEYIRLDNAYNKMPFKLKISKDPQAVSTLAQRDNTLVQQRDLQKKIANTTKINHSRFIVGKENYDKFNLNGEQIK